MVGRQRPTGVKRPLHALQKTHLGRHFDSSEPGYAVRVDVCPYSATRYEYFTNRRSCAGGVHGDGVCSLRALLFGSIPLSRIT